MIGANLLRVRRVSRSFLASVVLLICAHFAEAQTFENRVFTEGEALTEDKAVAAALRRAPLLDTIEGEVAIEEGRGRAVSAYPNPQLSYMREQTFGAFGTGENYLSLAQGIDISNRRGLHGEAGTLRVQAVRAEGDSVRVAVAADARFRFYEVLYRQGRIAVLEAWIVRIDKALTIVKRREQRGDAAMYDRRRLERERSVATGRLETERAGCERAQARLAAMLGIGAVTPRITGTLLPATDPDALSALHVLSGARPDLRVLGLRIEAAMLGHRAASRGWIPDLQLEGGWKGIELGQQGRTDGFLLGVSLTIPLWDASSGLARIAEGEAQAARGRHVLLRSEIEAELPGARAEVVRLRRAAIEFRDQASAASDDLVRIASVGYEGGEIGLLELLDAYRGSAEDALTTFDMEFAARRARIDLDRMTGERVPWSD